LRLGVSAGFTYTYDPVNRKVLDVRLDGTSIADDATVKVVVNSFLAAGGDNFTVFRDGTDKADSGRVDLQAQVDYLAANGTLNVPTEQRAVGVTGLDTADFTVGNEVTLGLTSLMMTGAGDPTDATVTAKLGKKNLGKFDVTNVLPTEPTDEHGTATLAFTVPKLKAGTYDLVVKGKATKTVVTIPVTVKAAPVVPPCKVTQTVTRAWHGGYLAVVSVKNTSDTPFKHWKVEWKFAGKEKVKYAWNAKVKQKGHSVVAKNSWWNGKVKPGKTVYFGYLGKGAPQGVSEFTLNGAACQ
jgi:5'-nucleotidase